MEELMKFFNKKSVRKIKRVLSAMLVFGLLLAISGGNKTNLLNLWQGETIYADPTTQQELDDLNDQIDDLENQYGNLEVELSEKAEELSDLLADKEILENDIATTQTAIEETEIALAEAKEQEEAEYEAMVIRIQYMYENSTVDSYWDAILNADGIVDLINRVEYVNQVHLSDRELLEQYQATVAEVETIAAELEVKMNDLLTLQEVYEHQEAELEAVMAELESEAEDYEEQIAVAEARATELAAEIARQNASINSGNSSGSSSGSSGSSSVSTSGGYLNDPSYDPAYTSGVNPNDLVNFALQFVGNPYVWGGNSLTNGCDCSGFVKAVYENFGFTGVPRYSQSFKQFGQPVAFANIKPGDIVVYPGHVAIYIGNGKIVEAQSTKAGITCNRSVTCSTITGIRRAL